MTDPIIDRLDQIKGRADAATEGPWEAEYSKEQGNCVLPPDYQSTLEAVAVTRLWRQTRDAEFIAAARTDVPRMEAALRAVLDLHKPEPYAQGPDYCDECEHKWPCPTYQVIDDELGVETEGGER